MQKTSLLFCFLWSLGGLFAQDIVVAPGTPGGLNQAIANNPGRTLVLRRGAPYLITGQIDITQPTIIKAEAGSGPRPLIVYQPTAGGTRIENMFGVNANLRLEGLHLTGRDALGGIVARMIRVSGAGARISLHDCIFDEAGQTVVRNDVTNTKYYVTNCIASRLGQTIDPDNGRFMDLRDVSVDTLWIENSAIYNVSSRLLRDGGTNGITNYLRFVQNTVVGVGQFGMEMRRVRQVVFQNNIIADATFLGSGKRFNTTDVRPMIFLDTVAGAPRGQWVISHNNMFHRAATAAAVPLIRAGNPDTLAIAPLFNNVANFVLSRLGTANTIFSEELRFTNPPVPPTAFITTERGGQRANSAPWDHSGLTPDPNYSLLTPNVPRYSTTHDLGYPRNTRSATAATDGGPLGARLFATTVRTLDLFSQYGVIFYPNPVKESLFVQGLDQIAQVRLLDIQGRLVQQFKPAGAYLEVPTAQLEAGFYVLSVVDAQGRVSAKKFVKE